MNKKTLKLKMIEIGEMGVNELNRFKEILSVSNVDTKAREFLNKSVMLREQELSLFVSLMAESSEYKEGDVE